MRSIFLSQLQKRVETEPFFHLTDTPEVKEFIRSNNCTFKKKQVYGGQLAIIKDKKTLEKIEIVLY